MGLGGHVLNRSGSVLIVLEGAPAAIDDFAARLPASLPAIAAIDSIALISDVPLPSGAVPAPFTVASSVDDEPMDVSIPADLAMCAECRAEIMDPDDRRHGYPFTTCTNCGPRYTVVNAMPYDRERTTLAAFPLCPRCRAEYTDPANRRFHAESTACPACGPRVSLTDCRGRSIAGEPLREARRRLRAGQTVAVRGLGGFLLAVDAENRPAIALLRDRKRRPAKPFAVMARDLACARRVCRVTPEAEELLTSPQAPIVVLDVDERSETPLALDLIAPDTQTLGVMLPTTPLHLLLAQGLPDDPTPPFDYLVMTSGNKRAEPICIANDEAYRRLADIADCFLVHDREVNLRNDDSLVVLQARGPQVWRRARGYAPSAITLTHPLARNVLAMGAELKNTIALGYDSRVVLSPHIGDLETPEAIAAHERAARELPIFFDRQPACVAVDAHPDMHATRLGHLLAARAGVPVVEVQHHAAHAVGCLAEHGETEGLALCFDGTGLGPDGAIWGAELLAVTASGITRRATFRPAALPGGDAAVHQPVRQLVARWQQGGIVPLPHILSRYGAGEEACAVWRRQCERGLNAPLTHAAGRLFDTFAVLLGLAPVALSYEGQAPICLEAAARRAPAGHPASLPFAMYERNDGCIEVDWTPAIAYLSDLGELDADARATQALACHLAVADAACRMVDAAAGSSALRTVALTGGVFMNRLLCGILAPRLEAMGFRVLTHQRIPPNDGGIAFGQAVVAGLHAS